MSIISSWHKSILMKHRGNPGLLLFAGVATLFGTYVFTKVFYKPYHNRQKRRQAKEFADYIIQQENKKSLDM